jgi:hypothetical protein
VLHRENTRLDALSLERDRSQWHRITRTQAVQLCRSHRVAVLFQTAGQDAASWFGPESRFFRSDSPYSYDSLRYFLQIGATAGTGWGKSAGMPNKPAASVELEPLEFEDQATGEMRSLGSPAAKTPKTPGGTNPSDLADDPTQAPQRGFGASDLADIPDLPTLKGFPIPIPEIPDAALDAGKQEIIPIEFRLVDENGVPLAPTPFQLALPDGTVKEGESDADGFIRVPDNTQRGETTLLLINANEALADSEKAASFGQPVPIEILLEDSQGNPLADTGFRLTFPDGTVEEGVSDGDGFIRFPDNEQTGEMELALVGDDEEADEEGLA